MKTIEIKLFTFDELSETAKENAINNYRQNSGDDYSYIWDDAYNTVKAFNNVFGLNEGNRSWLDYSHNFEENELELTGLRLRKYIINNYYYDIHCRKFYNSIGRNKEIFHPCIKINRYDISKGAICSTSNFYYSRIQYVKDCPLTGVCYDWDVLNPFYMIIDYKENYDDVNIIKLIDASFENLKNSIENEIEYLNSDKGIKESIEANEIDFTEDGEIY